MRLAVEGLDRIGIALLLERLLRILVVRRRKRGEGAERSIAEADQRNRAGALQDQAAGRRT